MIGPSQTRVPGNMQHSRERDIHSPDGIRTRNPNKPAATGLSLRPRDHCSQIYIKYKLRVVFFYVLLTVHPNIMIVFIFTILMHKFFSLIRLLHSSTCFEHYCAHLQEDNCINTASGIVTVFRWVSGDWTVTGHSPKDSDDTRCCVNTIVLLKMSTIVLETCRGM